MRILTRYVTKQVAAAIALVLAVLLGLELVIGVIDQGDDIGGRYTIGAAAYYTVMTLPSHLAQFLPFAVLIGCLAGLGSLASTSELTVIRAAGVSVARILWMALQPALVATLLGAAVAEYVAPKTEQIAQSYRALLQQEKDISISEYGLWHREGDNFVHFNAVQPDGVLFGVTIFTLDAERHMRAAMFAERATYQLDHWLLENVRETRFGGGQLQNVNEPSRRWETQLSPELLNILVLDPADLSISGLWKYVDFLDEQGSDSGAYELALWKKLLAPLAIVSLVLVAASIIFGPLRQSSMGSRIFAGLLIGIVFRFSQDMLGPASLVFGFPPVLASVIPISVSLAVGIYLLRRRL
jgi:lipopolysaccharide export system permease protein